MKALAIKGSTIPYSEYKNFKNYLIEDYKSNGYMISILGIKYENDESFMILNLPNEMMDTSENKDILSQIVKKVVKSSNKTLESTLFVSEVYFLAEDIDNVDMDNLPRPSESDNKKEGLMLIEQTSTTSSKEVYEIIRNNEDEFVVSDKPVISGEGKDSIKMNIFNLFDND